MWGYLGAGMALAGVLLYALRNTSSFSRLLSGRDAGKFCEGVIHAFPGMVIIFDARCRVVRLYNPDSRWITKSVKEIIGKKVSSLFDAAFCKLVEKGIGEVSAAGMAWGEEYVRGSGQHVQYFQVRFAGIVKDQIACFISDITPFRKAENDFRQNEILVSEILDNLPIPVMLKDIHDHFRYIYWNRECDKQAGIKREDILGKTDVEIFGEERGGRYEEIDRQVVEHAKPYRKQEAYITPDRKRHESIVLKNIISNDFHSWLLVVRWDITDMVKIQHQLEEVNRINELILNNTNAAFLFVDTSYVVQWENLPADHPLSERYKQGCICRRRAEGVTAPCRDCVVCKAMESGCVEELEMTFGNGMIVSLLATPVRNSLGKLLGVAMKAEDITIQKRNALELQQAKEKAEQADRLKSAFLENINHEIRTPLNAILGFSELMLSTPDGEQKAEFVTLIRNNNDLLLQLINDILDLSRIEADSLEFVYGNVDINRLLEELKAAAVLKVKNPAVLQVLTQPALENCVIYTDGNRLRQILFNFVNNALKFTEKGQIVLGYEMQGNDLRFYVSDTGSGIPLEKQHEIFNPFTKLDTFKTGTGLGLAICEILVKKMNGQIGVNSEPGTGSTFWFTLPPKQG